MENKVNRLIEDFHKVFCKTEELILKKTLEKLTLNEFRIIKTIGMQKILINELSQILQVTMESMVVSLNNIEHKGFIEKMQNNEDRRKVYVKLTDKGIESLKIHNTLYKKILKKLLIVYQIRN
jgi:Transcriptional regulators